MLVDDPRITRYDNDNVFYLVAKVNKRENTTRRLRQGVYEIGHFGSSEYPGPGYLDNSVMEDIPAGDQYKLKSGFPGAGIFPTYGVCDSIEQVLSQCPFLESSDRQFLITLTKVMRDDQSPVSGWRWGGWGPYIGDHEIKCEYLYDETGIDQVYVFHIYEKE